LRHSPKEKMNTIFDKLRAWFMQGTSDRKAKILAVCLPVTVGYGMGVARAPKACALGSTFGATHNTCGVRHG
jgi:hypothetical protein